jgi:hypothetical protein
LRFTLRLCELTTAGVYKVHGAWSIAEIPAF